MLAAASIVRCRVIYRANRVINAYSTPSFSGRFTGRFAGGFGRLMACFTGRFIAGTGKNRAP
ncbi:hypothetical protein PSP6_410057 [Paraburkholderia tropica]|nr:hypothetical protein PSP6_410057 [Paraburkholderia tropica]